MKAKLVILLATAALLGWTATAQAGGWDRGHRANQHRGYVTVKHHRHYRAPRHYGHRHYAPYRGHRHYRYPSYGHRHHYRDHDGWKIAAGAVLLGSIIHSASHDRGERVVRVERRSLPSRTSSGSEVWYRTDSSGDCFEVRLNADGYEVWTLVDGGFCR